MTDKAVIRLGFVGLRNIGMAHVQRALDLDGVSVTALSDTDPERLDAARKLVGPGAACYSSATDLFSSDVADAVVLAVPNPLHAPMAIEAMRRDKHVLVEKPMALNPAEAREMIRVRDETQRLLMVGMNQRFRADRLTAKRKIDAGVLGRIQQTHTRWLRDRTGLFGKGRGEWCLNPASSGGGPLIDLGIHKLDLALYLLDYPEIRNVTGFTSHGIGSRIAADHGKLYEIEDYAFGLIRFVDESILTVESSYFLNFPGEHQDLVIRGTDAALDISRESRLTTWPEGEPVETLLEPDATAAVNCVEHFARALRHEEPLSPTPEEGLIALEIVEAIYRSATSGCTINFQAAAPTNTAVS